MVAVDFKSVGEKASAKKYIATANTTPIGIKTPLRYGTQSDGIFAMHFDIAAQIKDNFRNLLLTNHGERLGLYDFGANLRMLSMEYGHDTFDADAITNIKTAIDKYMPFLSPKTFESTVPPSIEGVADRVDIKIIYDVQRLNIIGEEIVVTIFTKG